MDGHRMKKLSFLCLSGSKGNRYPHLCPQETDWEMCEDGNIKQNKGHKRKESWKKGKLNLPKQIDADEEIRSGNVCSEQ